MNLEGSLIAVGRTDTGRRRPHNEDAIRVHADEGLLVLADGMGGYSAGEVASRIAVDTVTRMVRNAPDMERADRVLRKAVLKANQAILEAARERPGQEGMGTTVVVCLLRRRRLTVAHVGDSRLYRFRRGQLEQLTVDHSLNQELLERGYYTKMEARRAGNRNVITRALGVGSEVEVALREEPVADGDVFLLCSDGLTDMIDDHSIRFALDKCGGRLEEAAERLIERANAQGGRDNISVILARASLHGLTVFDRLLTLARRWRLRLGQGMKDLITELNRKWGKQ
jgi:PPM family protein phosphatase